MTTEALSNRPNLDDSLDSSPHKARIGAAAWYAYERYADSVRQSQSSPVNKYRYTIPSALPAVKEGFWSGFSADIPVRLREAAISEQDITREIDEDVVELIRFAVKGERINTVLDMDTDSVWSPDRVRIMTPLGIPIEDYDLADQFSENRGDFVNSKGWRTGIDGDDDLDSYDGDPHTRYLIKAKPTEAGDQFVAGMRLTKVESFYESETCRMLRDRPDVLEYLHANHLPIMNEMQYRASKGQLYDITRFVTQMHAEAGITRIEKMSAMMELIGSAYADTALVNEERSEDVRPLWVFFAEPEVLAALNMSGVEVDIMFAGKVYDDDKEPSYLCVVDPSESFDTVRHSLAPGNPDGLTEQELRRRAMAFRAANIGAKSRRYSV